MEITTIVAVVVVVVNVTFQSIPVGGGSAPLVPTTFTTKKK